MTTEIESEIFRVVTLKIAVQTAKIHVMIHPEHSDQSSSQ